MSGPKIFDNDDAMDWIYDLQEEGSLADVNEALDLIVRSRSNPLDLTDSRIALAAGEIVAAMNGDSSPELPEEAEDWLIGKPSASEVLRAKAEEAIRKILQTSELIDYWTEREQLDSWRFAVNDLIKRLEA